MRLRRTAIVSLVLILAIAVTIGTTFFGATDMPDSLDQRLEEHAIKQGITEKGAIKELVSSVRAILDTREHLAAESLREPCAQELAQLCGKKSKAIATNDCLKKHRPQVSAICELALRKEFGSLPLTEATLHQGISLPAGTWFFYDNHSGDLLGAITSGPVTVNGIEFKAGQIRFNRSGLSVGELTRDQVINGIKYKAGELSVFFYDDGQVENAILAEDTVIEGVAYKGGTQIMFHPNGKVSLAYLADTGELVAYELDGSRQPVQPSIQPYSYALLDSGATKPICSAGVVPTIECLPQRFAQLPPDPAQRGKQTLKGIDLDRDGLRDDVQRFIALNWGFSEKAVKALSGIARNVQKEIELGGDISRDDAYEIAKASGKAVTCYSRSVDEKITYSSALKEVIKQVTNTDERARRYRNFDSLLAGRVFMLDDEPIAELCGYDPAALPN
jgi:hypothetical protein